MPRALAGLVATALIVAATLLGIRWWNAPATVPDHATVFSATNAMLFAGPATLAQHVRPSVNGFTAVDLILAAEAAGLPGDLELRVIDRPSGSVLRAGRLPARQIPEAHVWDVRPGTQGERWQSIGFEPIPDSAGRDYLVEVSYPAPGGVDTPGRRLATLARFPGAYPPGALLVNGNSAGGELLIRLGAAGSHGQAVAMAAGNLARVQPVSAGTLLAPAIAGALSVWFAGALAVRLGRLR